jgi:hypothetical protein
VVPVTALAAVAIAAVGGGCGSGAGGSPQASFAWLRPGPPPHRWRAARLPDRSATLAYPPGWRPIRSDPGTVTAALRGPTGRVVGYLNATPQQGAETFENWSDFRIEHNGDEGDRRVRLGAAGQHLAFRSGASGSCVVDDYLTESGHPYREIACLVGSARATTVVVGAAPPSRWPRSGPQIERAISAFAT